MDSGADRRYGRVRAHGGGAGRRRTKPAYAASGLAAGRAPPGLPVIRVGRQEGVRSGSCHARRRAVTDLLWADDVREYWPPRRGRVVPACRSHGLGGADSAPRGVGDCSHGRWSAGQRAEPLWEVRGRTGTTATAVVAVNDGFTRVIAEDVARADPLSLTRTRDAAAWTSARLVLRCLRLLQRDGVVPAGAASRNRSTYPPEHRPSCGVHGDKGGVTRAARLGTATSGSSPCARAPPTAVSNRCAH